MALKPLTNWRRSVLVIILFGAAFGYLEAAVVTYLRALHETARVQFHPERNPANLFPLLTLDQVRAAGQERTLAIEIGREAATIIMLAAIAMAVSRDAREWTAAFALAFGVWDSVFYLCLKLLLGWPESFLTWDILFLIPVPWVGPVLAPLLTSFAMMGTGIWTLRRESAGTPLRIRWWNITGIVFGALIIVLSFTLDYRNALDGGAPRAYHWEIFWLGMAIGVAGYAQALGLRAPASFRRFSAPELE